MKPFGINAWIRWSILAVSFFLPMFRLTYGFGGFDEFGLFIGFFFVLPNTAFYMLESPQWQGVAAVIGMLAASFAIVSASFAPDRIVNLITRSDSASDTKRASLDSILVVATAYIVAEALLLGQQTLQTNGLFGLMVGSIIVTFAVEGRRGHQ